VTSTGRNPGGRERERSAWCPHASGHRQRNDGSQSLGRRGSDRPDAAAGQHQPASHHPSRRRRGRGCAVERARKERCLLRVRAARTGRRAVGQAPDRRRRNGFEHPRTRAGARFEPRFSCAPASRDAEQSW